MTGDIKIILPAPKKVVDDPAKKTAELEAKKLANQKVAQRFVMPLSSDQTRLTFEACPDLESAYNGTFAGELDLRNIRVISPERVDRAVGPYIDPASQRAAQRAREYGKQMTPLVQWDEPSRTHIVVVILTIRKVKRMKAKVEKFEGRAEYLRSILSKTVPADVLDKPNLTYGDVANANSTLYEYWQLSRRADVENALRQPAGQAAAQQSKDANAFRRFATGEGWNSEDHAQLVENMKRIKADFPAVVHNRSNSDAIAAWLLESKRYPSGANMRLAVTTLVCEGKLLLSPAALGPEFEQRYGDELNGPYAMSRVSAADLKLMTTPYSAPAVDDESKLSADEYWAAHPELAAERHKHDRALIEGEVVRKAESEVERFLQTQLNYEPTSNNKRLMLDYLTSHKLPLTAEALVEAFRALKPQLAQSDKGLEFGSTWVIDLGERNQNPSYISTELRDDLRRKIARFSSQQY